MQLSSGTQHTIRLAQRAPNNCCKALHVAQLRPPHPALPPRRGCSPGVLHAQAPDGPDPSLSVLLARHGVSSPDIFAALDTFQAHTVDDLQYLQKANIESLAGGVSVVQLNRLRAAVKAARAGVNPSSGPPGGASSGASHNGGASSAAGAAASAGGPAANLDDEDSSTSEVGGGDGGGGGPGGWGFGADSGDNSGSSDGGASGGDGGGAGGGGGGSGDNGWMGPAGPGGPGGPGDGSAEEVVLLLAVGIPALLTAMVLWRKATQPPPAPPPPVSWWAAQKRTWTKASKKWCHSV